MPIVLTAIVFNISAGVWYGVQRDWARLLYWWAAALINVATLLMRR